jgi:hypothetical protein
MKYIKFFESFKTPFGDEIDETNPEGAARKFRSLVKDVDIEYALDEIRNMLSNGEFASALKSYDINVLFGTLIEKGRLDIADILHDSGYKITDKDRVVRWVRAGKPDDDKEYAINRYL